MSAENFEAQAKSSKSVSQHSVGPTECCFTEWNVEYHMLDVLPDNFVRRKNVGAFLGRW